MLSFHNAQNEAYVIFGIAPARLGEVAKKVRKLPHKFVMGFWKGQMEPSCLMPFDTFMPLAEVFGKGEECYLHLARAHPKTGTRAASLVYFDTGKVDPIGLFQQVAEPPADGGGFTLDPETGNFFAVV